MVVIESGVGLLCLEIALNRVLRPLNRMVKNKRHDVSWLFLAWHNLRRHWLLCHSKVIHSHDTRCSSCYDFALHLCFKGFTLVSTSVCMALLGLAWCSALAAVISSFFSCCLSPASLSKNHLLWLK